jgi:hypothetical protein
MRVEIEVEYPPESTDDFESDDDNFLEELPNDDFDIDDDDLLVELDNN